MDPKPVAGGMELRVEFIVRVDAARRVELAASVGNSEHFTRTALAH